jgi:hypothetical protein
MMGGSSGTAAAIPYNAGGPGYGGTVYEPNAQGQFDQYYQQLVKSFIDPYTAGTTPAQTNYPLAQGAAGNILNNPYAAGAQNTAGQLGDIGQGLLGTLQNWLPLVTSPFASQAFEGAQTGAGYGGQAAAQGAGAAAGLAGLPAQVAGLAQQTAGYAPQVAGLAQQTAGLAPQVAALAPQVAAGIAPLQAGARGVMDTGFDPRRELYQRTQQQVGDQSNAINSMYGLGTSPYGAGLAAQNNRNFNMALGHVLGGGTSINAMVWMHLVSAPPKP